MKTRPPAPHLRDAADERPPSRAAAFRAAIARRGRTVQLAYRALVGTVGLLLVVLGVALLPLPGPGWLIIFAGLAVLSTEFAWAKRLLRFARRQVSRWTHWMGRQPWWLRGLVGLGCLAVVAAAIGAYVAVVGLPAWADDTLGSLS